MCRIALRPPQLLIASPAQAPVAWLLVALLIFGIVVALFIPRFRERFNGAMQPIVVGTYALSLLSVSCAVFLGLIVYVPWLAAAGRWYDTEAQQLSQKGCSLASLNQTYESARQTASSFSIAAQWLMGAAALLFALMFFLIWRWQHSQRHVASIRNDANENHT